MTNAVLKIDETEVELPVVEATDGSSGVNIGKVLAQTGYTTLDTGFVNTASCQSSITYIDGANGVLRYRGYPIEQLAEKSSFLEVSYLLLYGELPTKEQYDKFTEEVHDRMMLDERLRELYRSFPRGAHPMMVLSAGIMALGAYNRKYVDPHNPEHVHEASMRLLGSMPALAASAYKSSVGEPFLYPKKKLGYVENYLRLSFGTPMEDYEIDPAIVSAFETLFILHADHEQNCSTATVRMVGSSDANLYASISSGVNALSGPLHGGANQAVLEMLANIRDNGMDIKDFVAKVKDKKSGVKLMGFGHRVYKNGDSRVPTMKAALEALVAHYDRRDVLDLYEALEREFVERKGIHPNLDYPSGPAYNLIGFDTLTFTPLFVAARVTGWTAHIMEQQASNALIRPLSAYVGPDERHVP